MSDRVRIERQLLQGLSHELRAPLQSLLGHLDLLRAGAYGPLNDAQAGALETIGHSAERILAVTRDVLQVARIVAGAERVDAADFDLAALVAREVEAMLPLASAKGLRLSTEGAGTLVVHSDVEKIARILTNVLSNALKYTREGSVAVRVGAAGDRAFVEVVDTGPGIPADKREAVFDEYVRLEGTPGEGTGLGLPIARRLARLCGGTLTLRCPARGTIVRLELPGR
jgi:signal transduction histidine kinase